MKPCLLLLAILADRFANLEESNLAFLLDQKNSENTKKAQKLLVSYFENIQRKQKLTVAHFIKRKVGICYEKILRWSVKKEW